MVPTLYPAPGMFPDWHTGGYSFTPLSGGIIPTSVVPPSLLFWKSADTYPPTPKVPPGGSVPDVGVANTAKMTNDTSGAALSCKAILAISRQQILVITLVCPRSQQHYVN